MDSGPYFSLIFNSLEAISLRASSQLTRSHLPSPLSPIRLRGYFNLFRVVRELQIGQAFRTHVTLTKGDDRGFPLMLQPHRSRRHAPKLHTRACIHSIQS